MLNRMIFAALLMFCLAGSPAHAASTNDMLRSCKALINNLGGGRDDIARVTTDGLPCWYYFLAIQDMSNIVVTDIRHPILGICAPAKSRLTQLIRVFVEYAQQDPAELNEPAASIALLALRKAFPCLPPTAD